MSAPVAERKPQPQAQRMREQNRHEQQQQFEDAFSAYQLNDDEAELETYVAKYPQSQGADLYRSLLALSRQLAQQNLEVVTLQQHIDEQDQRIRSLRQEKLKLEETLEQLKVSLIEQEQRRN